MRAVDQPVEDGIGDGWIADMGMPVLNRQLAGDDGGGASVPIVDDLQQIASLLGGEWGQSPIVEDEHLYVGQALQHPGITPIAPGQAEAFQHARHTLIKHGAVVAAGALSQGAGRPCLADAGRAGDQQILLAFNPFSLCQFLKQGAVETAVRAVIDILRRGGLAQPGEAQAGLQPLVVTLQNLRGPPALLDGRRS